MGPENALIAVSALHVGFQAVVTLVVYPALAEVLATTWTTAHDAHSRRIAAVVAPVYLAVAAAWLVLADRARLLATLLALGAAPFA